MDNGFGEGVTIVVKVFVKWRDFFCFGKRCMLRKCIGGVMSFLFWKMVVGMVKILVVR